jgi:hypothetical protein
MAGVAHPAPPSALEVAVLVEPSEVTTESHRRSVADANEDDCKANFVAEATIHLRRR